MSDELHDGELHDGDLPDEGLSEGLANVFSDVDFHIPRNAGLLAGLVGLFIVGFFLLCIWRGLRQMREANGTWRQLLPVSAFVGGLWTLPVVAAATLIWFDIGQQPGAVWWLYIGFCACFSIHCRMAPPNRSSGGKDALPECDSPEMLARIDQLAKRLGVATPTVRTQRAMHRADNSVAASVGGLAPPSIVLHDTVLSQLREDEQDAMIGCELGRVANRSIWIDTAIAPLTVVAMVILSFLGGGFFGVIAGSALWIVSSRLLNSWFAYDCDRRAALATSPDAVAWGWQRLCARHVYGNFGLLTAVVCSAAIRSTLHERIHALQTLAASGAAGDGQSVTVNFDSSRVALCRQLVVAFAFLWIGLTTFGIAASLINGVSWLPMLAVSAGFFGPPCCTLLSQQRHLRVSRARAKGRWRWAILKFRTKLGLVCLVGAAIVGLLLGLLPSHLLFLESGEPNLVGIIVQLFGVALVGGVIIAFICKPIDKQAGEKMKLERSIPDAVKRNDFEGVIKICRENYKVVKQDKQLNYSGAAALLATRQLENFIPLCEQIREEFPHFPPPAITLAEFYLDQSEPQKAMEVIRGIEQDLDKSDPLPAIMSSRALLDLGQLDEAKTECIRAAELSPRDVSVIAQAACVALATSDFEEADRLIEQGNSLLPSEPLLIIARAEQAMAAVDRESLQTERDALAAALKGDRMLNLYSQLNRFDAALADEPNV